MSELKSEKEIVSPEVEILLKNTMDLNDKVRDVLDNGTLEQKVELLVSDYKRRIVNDEFAKQQEIQRALTYAGISVQIPTLPKL